MTTFEKITNYILAYQPKEITYTPGPWNVTHFCDPIDVKVQDQGLYEVEEANETINQLLRDNEYIKAQMIAESNRKLIEVAPIMVQILRNVLDCSPVDINDAKMIIDYIESDLKENLV